MCLTVRHAAVMVTSTSKWSTIHISFIDSLVEYLYQLTNTSLTSAACCGSVGRRVTLIQMSIHWVCTKQISLGDCTDFDSMVT